MHDNKNHAREYIDRAYRSAAAAAGDRDANPPIRTRGMTFSNAFREVLQIDRVEMGRPGRLMQITTHAAQKEMGPSSSS